ncbi:hypothetical protein [Nocardioides sp.]|uniref:hypothetical protein n=1 Tax=Nocardioides sp. TaxID=35761 RepID=UPI003517F89B
MAEPDRSEPTRGASLREVVRAQVEELRWAGAHPAHAASHARRARELEAGAGLDPAREQFTEHLPLVATATEVRRMLAELRSPFEGWLEVPVQVAGLAPTFEPPIDAAIAATRAALEDLLVGILARIHELPED